MLRFFLFMVGVMTVGTSAAGEVSPCSYEVPIQIIVPSTNGFKIKTSAAEVDPEHFRAFVTAVTKHINSRLTRDKFCITSAKNMENIGIAGEEHRSLLQFVRWPLFMDSEYIVPLQPYTGWHGDTICRLSSPWMDLTIERKPVPQIVGIFRWNERQLLADQAVLAGAKNVPLNMAMPLMPSELGHFMSEYEHADEELFYSRKLGKPAPKPIEERVPPDLLWLLRPSGGGGRRPFIGHVTGAMDKAAEKSAKGYTKLVLALIDRCFAAPSGKENLHYTNILDAADLIPLEQYKIDMSTD
jgi:hypothetical protein